MAVSVIRPFSHEASIYNEKMDNSKYFKRVPLSVIVNTNHRHLGKKICWLLSARLHPSFTKGRII